MIYISFKVYLSKDCQGFSEGKLFFYNVIVY